MAKLPKNPNDTAELIYRSYELNADDGFRAHLGASIIGDECRRKLWYEFRWATKKKHPGRVLRLFQRGQDEELRFADDLRAIGCEVYLVDQSTGEQFRVSACGGHFGGSLDGAIKGLPEAPAHFQVVEMKTHNDKSFKDLCKQGVEKSKPLHYAQMLTYMHLTGMKRALYLAVNKNDDSIYTERVHHDAKKAEKLLEKARTVIDSPEPLERISERPDWFECKWCDHHPICHGNALPEVNCRTCAHSTPVGNGKWECSIKGDISFDIQLTGCEQHLYQPALVSFAELLDSDGKTYVHYRMKSGTEFRNDVNGAYTSRQLRNLPKELFEDEGVKEIMETFKKASVI